MSKDLSATLCAYGWGQEWAMRVGILAGGLGSRLSNGFEDFVVALGYQPEHEGTATGGRIKRLAPWAVWEH